jgi:hypothetical protein
VICANRQFELFNRYPFHDVRLTEEGDESSHHLVATFYRNRRYGMVKVSGTCTKIVPTGFSKGAEYLC